MQMPTGYAALLLLLHAITVPCIWWFVHTAQSLHDNLSPLYRLAHVCNRVHQLGCYPLHESDEKLGMHEYISHSGTMLGFLVSTFILLAYMQASEEMDRHAQI